MANWSLVKDFVKSNFKDYFPVPTIADGERYQPLNFLLLQNGTSFAARWYEKPLRLLSKTPIFESVGEINNFASHRPLEDGSPIPLPEVHKKKLFNHGKDAPIIHASTLEGQIKKHSVECAEGSMKTYTVSPSLGEISRYSVSYRDLRAWIEQYCFLVSAEDMRQEAKKGKFFVIHDVIMAEKISGTGKLNQQSISGRLSSFLKLNYEYKGNLYLERPSEFGPCPIAFKIGQIQVRRLKHAWSTGIYRLKLEPLRDFCKSSTKRKFDKENSPSSDDSLSPSNSRPTKRAREEGNNGGKARKCLAKILG